MSKFHLAQCNVATMLGEADDPVMAGFFERLVPLNALADAFTFRVRFDADGNSC